MRKCDRYGLTAQLDSALLSGKREIHRFRLKIAVSSYWHPPTSASYLDGVFEKVFNECLGVINVFPSITYAQPVAISASLASLLYRIKCENKHRFVSVAVVKAVYLFTLSYWIGFQGDVLRGMLYIGTAVYICKRLSEKLKHNPSLVPLSLLYFFNLCNSKGSCKPIQTQNKPAWSVMRVH